MSQALTTLFVEAGNEVRLTNSRGPESLQELVSTFGPNVEASTVAEAVPWADAVFLATPWGKTAEAVSVVDDWSGVVVVDTTNNRTKPGPDGLIDIGDSVSSVIVAGYMPGAHVVKALNVTPIPWMSAALGADSSDTNAVYIAGDDAAAKALVSEIVASIGGVAVDAGDLATGGRLLGMGGALSSTLEMVSPDDARARVEATRAG
jgi:predicted dinucleotide-binding enzyme